MKWTATRMHYPQSHPSNGLYEGVTIATGSVAIRSTNSENFKEALCLM